MGYPVNAPNELSAVLFSTEISNLTTTRQALALPSGAKYVTLSYRLLPGATATASQMAKFCLNAASDADADARLATTGAYIPLYQGEDVTISAESGSLITRLDVIAAQAVGSEVTSLRIVGGL